MGLGSSRGLSLLIRQPTAKLRNRGCLLLSLSPSRVPSLQYKKIAMRKILLIAALLLVGCSEGFKTPKKFNAVQSGQTGTITGGTSGGTVGGTSGGTTGGTSGGTTGTTGGTSGGTTSGGTTTGGGCTIVPGPSSRPACTNGRMENYKDYFFFVINRAEGSCADDWVQVLGSSSLEANPGPGEIRGDGSSHYGMTQQRNSAGEPRGRIFLPTDTPDPEYNYYIHGVDVLRDMGGGHFVWAWNDWIGGQPAIAPRACY
jgi:hypothetical protein